MTKDLLKRIPVLFLSIAWMVFTFHLIIPHDHHLTDSFGNREDSCPGYEGHKSHSPGYPIHCHAFNEVASEKATIIKIQRSDHQIDTFAGIVSERISLDTGLAFIPEPFTVNPFVSSYLLEISPFRAPPALI